MTVSANQPAYKNYTLFLPAYMSAYITRSKTSIMTPYHPLKWQTTNAIVTSTIPPVTVSFTGVPITETLEIIRAAGGREAKSKGQNVFFIPSPTSDLLRNLSNAGVIKTTPALSNSVNMSALPILSLVRRVFSNFLFTHTYPAFIDASHLEYNKDNWITWSGSEKRKASDILEPGASKRARTMGDAEPGEISEDITMIEPTQDTSPANTIIYAMPPAEVLNAWGSPDQIPAGDGLFVRYIAETQNGRGERIVPLVINRYFLGCLGANAESVRQTFELLKSGWGVICDTDPGKELSHLAMCIDIGLQCQARIFPIIDGAQYLGCCLMGAGFQIAAYGSVYSPVDQTTLQEKVGLATSHKSALTTIATIVSYEDSTSEDYRDVMKASGMMDIRQVCLRAQLGSQEREQIVAAARGLRFQPKSLPVSADNISKTLLLIADSSADLDSLPIHFSKLFEENRAHLVWSAFGELAPTFRFAGGPQVDLTRSRDLPTHIALRQVALPDALIDLDMTLRDKKFPNASNNRRSGPFKDRIYTKLDARQIFTALVAASGVNIGAESGKKDRTIEVVGGSVLDDGF